MDSLLYLADFASQLTKKMARHWVIVCVCFICGLALSAAIARAVGPKYTSTMTVMPASSQSESRLSSLAASVNLPFSLGGLIQNHSKMPAYMQLLQSKTVAAELMKQYDIQRLLFGKAIDPKTGEWKKGAVFQVKQALYGIFGISFPHKVQVDEVARRLNALLIVSQDRETGLVTISCTYRTPDLCPRIILLAHKAAEETLNKLSLDRALSIKKYTEKEMHNTSFVEVRNALIELLQTAEKQIVMSQLDQPVAASILDGPTVSNVPSFPRPGIMILMGALLGLGLGGLVSWYAPARPISIRYLVETGAKTIRPTRHTT